jgi:hypothetical protein
VSDQVPEADKPNPENDPLRSPVRPAHRELLETAQNQESPKPEATEPISAPKNPGLALELLRRKMEEVATEFASGKINRAQFNAIYGRYDEKRTIVERLLERDPDSEAWQQVVRPGHTSFLMQHFAARIQYYLVFRHGVPRPLMMGGQQQPDIGRIIPVLTALYKMPQRPGKGLARKPLGKGQWLVLAMGEYALTIVVYNLEPSPTQLNRVRDLHNDFERANYKALQRGTGTLDKMVFPQRALVEQR